MNKIVNKFLFSGDTFMPEMHLRSLYLHIVVETHLQKTKTEYKKNSFWQNITK